MQTQLTAGGKVMNVIANSECHTSESRTFPP
jgi:hypothetical protein